MIEPLTKNDAALAFLQTRRSRPPKFLGPGAPDASELQALLTLAARVPDHGKLEPFRFVVLRRAACARFAEAVLTHGATRGEDPDRLKKAADAYVDRDLMVAVVAAPKASDKIPEGEQVATAACVCFALVNACLASGWGASWLTGWMATDRAFLAAELDLAPHEWVSGFIHIGAEATPPQDRPRPDIMAFTTWITE